MHQTATNARLQPPYFSEMVDQTVDAHSGFKEIKIPEEYRQRQKGKIEFKARFFTARQGDLRSVHISGPRIEIINIFFFPSPELAIPVFAMEFVVFAKKPVVGVIDLKPLNGSPHTVDIWQSSLDQSHQKFRDLVQGEDPPGWYQECRSGKDFFVRPNDLEQMQRLKDAHVHVWNQLSQAMRTIPILNIQQRLAHNIAIQDYKNHHRENSPGLPFLNRSFGAEWTNDFLSKFLFR